MKFSLAVVSYAFFLASCSCQEIETATGTTPDAERKSQCTETDIRKLCRLISEKESVDFIVRAVQSEDARRGSCINDLGYLGRYDVVTKSCRECPENGCGTDTNCLASCSVPLKLFEVIQELKQLNKTFRDTAFVQQGQIDKISSELLCEIKTKAAALENLAKAALAFAIISFAGMIGIVVLGWHLRKRFLFRKEQHVAVQQTTDVKYEQPIQAQPEQNELLRNP